MQTMKAAAFERRRTLRAGSRGAVPPRCRAAAMSRSNGLQALLRCAVGVETAALDQLEFRREVGQLRAVAHAETLAQLAQVVVDVVRAGLEAAPNLLVRGAFGDAQ